MAGGLPTHDPYNSPARRVRPTRDPLQRAGAAAAAPNRGQGWALPGKATEPATGALSALVPSLPGARVNAVDPPPPSAATPGIAPVTQTTPRRAGSSGGY